MASVYDVQQLRAPGSQRSAAENAAAGESSRTFRVSMSLDESMSLSETHEWNTAAFSPAPYSHPEPAHPYQSYSAIDVMFGARANNTGLDGLFGPAFYNPHYGGTRGGPAYGGMYKTSAPSCLSDSGSQDSLLSDLKSKLTTGGHPYPMIRGGAAHHQLMQSESYYDPLPKPRPECYYDPLPKQPRRNPPVNDPLNVLGKSPEIVKFLEENYERADDLCSIPRCDVYQHYEEMCHETGQIVTCQASFGKVIRQLFPWLKARRLGTRGRSKYHYCGIRQVRPQVPIHKLYATQHKLQTQDSSGSVAGDADSPRPDMQDAPSPSTQVLSTPPSPAPLAWDSSHVHLLHKAVCIREESSEDTSPTTYSISTTMPYAVTGQSPSPAHASANSVASQEDSSTRRVSNSRHSALDAAMRDLSDPVPAYAAAQGLLNSLDSMSAGASDDLSSCNVADIFKQ